MTLFQDKYRVESTRLKEFDYSLPADYYVTICVEKRVKTLGAVVADKVELNENGMIADKYWKILPEEFNNIELGEYIIMPEHMHGIITIVKQTKKTLSNIVQSFKSRSTIAINKSSTDKSKFKWQKRFFDRIIRDEKEYVYVSEYIKNNPINISLENYYKEWWGLQDKKK